MSRRPIDLNDHLTADRVVDLEATRKEDVLAELVRTAATSDAVRDEEALLEAVRAREEIMSTGIGLGIAIPHARIPSVERFVVAVGRSERGIPDFESIDGKPVHIVVLIAGPHDTQKHYLELLAQLSKRLKLQDVRARICAGAPPDEVVALLIGL